MKDQLALAVRATTGNHSYKIGGALEAHFGLGKRERANLRVTLPNGKKQERSNIQANRFFNLNFSSGKIVAVETPDRKIRISQRLRSFRSFSNQLLNVLSILQKNNHEH